MKRRPRGGFAVVLLLPLLACSPPRAEPTDSTALPAARGEQHVVGVVRQVGSAPVNVELIVQPASGGAVRIEGEMKSELERLAGAEVAIWGRITPARGSLAERQIAARTYEILGINGEPVIAGIVESVSAQGARLRTTSGEIVQISNPPREFQAGQKVWIQGPRTVVVQSYGTIRP